MVVIDPGGASVTLSHFCPTAAGLLFGPTPLAIVEAPSALTPEHALSHLERATDTACSWRPGREPLAVAIRHAFAQATTNDCLTTRWAPFDRPVNAFLAAHAFASWTAYDRDGLRAIPRAVAHALETLKATLEDVRLTRETLTEAIRATDLQLRHAQAAPHSQIEPGRAGSL